MFTLARGIDSSTASLNKSGPGSFNCPAVLLASLTLTQKVRGLWQLKLLTETIKPENRWKLSAGGLIGLAAGERRLTLFIAYLVLVLRRIQVCAQQKKKISDAKTELYKNIFIGRRLKPEEVKEKLVKVAKSAFLLLAAWFVFAMRFLDVMDCYKLCEWQKKQAVYEIGVHFSALVEEAAKDKEKMLSDLSANKEAIDHLLLVWGMPISADFLISTLSAGILGGETLLSGGKRIAYEVEDTVREGIYFMWCIVGTPPKGLLRR